ncbi:hypothetical protein QYE76_036588 [Lolium multiflorum]|uniref:Uncharacterized protein n=1 Tax=Lolium multiflorum TaxID=4521 RepID=A0AAD8R168_LOLMU|nr:hypothetical protein QYE76_036588 [Lolium multiflorum]
MSVWPANTPAQGACATIVETKQSSERATAEFADSPTLRSLPDLGGRRRLLDLGRPRCLESRGGLVAIHRGHRGEEAEGVRGCAHGGLRVGGGLAAIHHGHRGEDAEGVRGAPTVA